MDLIEHIGLRRHHARPAPAFEFDPHTRAFHENPHPSYRHLRDTAPITYWQGGDAWLISRYADVVAVQRDNRFSVTRPGVTLRDVNAAPVGRVKSAVDMLTPPDDCARRFPRLIAPFFTPQKIGLLQSALIDIVDRQIAGLKPRFDLVADYCEKVAIRAVAQVLAVPEKYLLIFYRFARAYGDIAAANITGAPASHSQRTMDFDVGVALLRQIIAERR
jgi:cytochrome P450